MKDKFLISQDTFIINSTPLLNYSEATWSNILLVIVSSKFPGDVSRQDPTLKPLQMHSIAINFGIIKAKKREIERDRGPTWRSSYEEFWLLYANSLLSGICIGYCFLFLVYLCVHHDASSYRSRKKVSKVRIIFSAI